jgi:hypothetical protein
MTNRKQSALVQIATRGGSVNEQIIAAKMLAKNTTLVEYKEESNDRWEASGVLIRYRNEVKAYLRQNCLIYFLKQVGNKEFTYKDIKYTDDFGSGDFYTILSWLLKNNLVLKIGSRYIVLDSSLVVTTWNHSVERMKI